MSKKNRAVPADEVKTEKQEAQPQQADDASFGDILGLGIEEPEAAPEQAAADDTEPEQTAAPDGGDDEPEQAADSDAPADEPAGDPPADEPEQAAADTEPDTEPVEKKSGTAKAMLAKLTPALNRLTGVVEKVKKGGDKPLPGDAISAIKGVADTLKGIVGSSDKTEKAAPLSAVTTALTKITDVVKKLKDAGDGDVPSGVEGKLKSALGALNSAIPAAKTEKKFEIFKGADDTVIIKAGAKMKKARLNKLKKAVQELATLISELEGEPTEKRDEPAPAPVDLSPVLEKIDELASATKSRFEKVEESTGAVSKRLDEIENMRPAGNGEADPPEPVKKNEDENFWAGVL